MAAKFTVFFVLCAVAAVRADADIPAQVIQWANEQLEWLHADGIEFPRWVAEVIANTDVNEDIKTLVIDLREWAVQDLSELKGKFTAIKQLPDNPSPEELQQLRKDIQKIQQRVAYSIETFSEHCDDLYTKIVEDLLNPTSEANKEALVAIDEYLHNAVQGSEEWRDKGNGEGDSILSQIPAQK